MATGLTWRTFSLDKKPKRSSDYSTHASLQQQLGFWTNSVEQGFGGTRKIIRANAKPILCGW